MGMTRYDAWVLRRIVSMQDVEGRLETMSPGWRPIGLQLLEYPADFRPQMLAGALLREQDPKAMIRAVQDVDPSGPPPEVGPTPEASQPTRPPVKMLPVSSYEAKPVEWLWQGRVPRGMLSMWAGAPKRGKSYVSLALAAAVSRGLPMPGGPEPDGCGSVVLMSAEDDIGRTIAPRLIAAGADIDRIHILEAVYLPDGGESLPSLKLDIEKIAAAAESIDSCRLIVIDPISAYLGGVDDHRNTEIRSVLGPLKAVAERLDLSVVLLSHLNKGSSADGLQRVLGSIGMGAACRANSLFVRDRNDPSGRRVLMLDNGGNLSASVPTLAYSIEALEAGGRVRWHDDVPQITAEEALAAEMAGQQEAAQAPERREAERWLREVLADGPVAADQVLRNADAAGVSRGTLRRMKKAMGIQAKKEGFGGDTRWTWSLSAGGG